MKMVRVGVWFGLTIVLAAAVTTRFQTSLVPEPDVFIEPVQAQTSSPPDNLVPLDSFSPQFLGMFRKAMTIEDEIRTYSDKYGVDFDLARAMAIQESGGNPHLTSIAGAGGYFQVMPATFRGLNVDTNIEAGVKYIGQMVRQFKREDYAVAAYNGGPGRARGGRPPLETLQYVLSVGAYRNVLKLYKTSVRHHAERIKLEPIREGDSWWAIAQRTGVSVVQLRLHNPFLATRALRVGQYIAYPPEPRDDLLEPSTDGYVGYRARLGDNYLHLAFTLGLDRDVLRAENDLWHLQTLPAGQQLKLPLAWTGKYDDYTVRAGDTLGSIAEAMDSTPWRIIRDNSLFWNDPLTPGTVLRIRPEEPKPTFVTYRVASGDTLGAISTRYGTSVRAIQNANNMGQRTVIQIGQRLRIPSRNGL